MSREHKRSARYALLEMLAGAIEQTADSVVITDSGGNIEYVNPAFEQTSGYRRDEVLGRTPRIVKSGAHDESFYKTLWETILGGRVYREVITNRRKDGSLYYEEKTITPLRDAEGRVTHFVSTGKNVTERVKAEEKLNYLAHHDTLTGLPNRNLLRDRLDQSIRRTARHGGRFAVLILDLDNFKTVNDSLGHEMGDLLLKAVGERLQALVRDGDTVARLGGDEFVIVLEDIGRMEDAAGIAQKLIENLSTAPFEVDGHKIFLTVSIGVAAAPADGAEADTLLKHADTALYRAKERGRNAYQLYTAEMTAQVRERLRLRTQTQLALERGEYLLYYQPIVDLKTGEVAAVEALIRWRHPEQGIVTPDVFIPVLEESGLIARVGEWVLRTVCEHIREFQKLREKPVRVTVNISGKQFNDPDFATAAGCMRCLYAGNGRCAGIAEFEVTENVLVRNDAVTTGILGALRANGVRLAIDDFGTGYSSLAYLARFAPDTTKIDRSFIRDVETDPRAAALVGAIIAMSHALGAIVVAEGVETPGQLAMLRASGCDMFQGYLFSPPLPVDEIRRLLSTGTGLA